MISKKITVRSRIPVTVEWRCSKCERYNSARHLIEVRGAAKGGLLVKDEVLQGQALKFNKENVKKMFLQFQQNDFFPARMKFGCQYCEHKEAWASYLYFPRLLKQLLFVAMMALCIIGLLHLDDFRDDYIKTFSVIALLFAVVLFEPAFYAVERLIQKIRIGKLPEANKPTITVHAFPELEAFLSDCLPAEHPRIIIQNTSHNEESKC